MQKSESFFIVVFSLFVLGVSSGCTREMDKKASKVTLRLPSAQGKTIGAQSIDMTTTCFAVNIYGEGINTSPNSCGITVGVYSGMTKGNGNIELDVPKGSNRTIELIRYDLANASDACPTSFDPSNCSDISMCAMYRSGEALNVDTTDDEVLVTIILDSSATASYSSAELCSSGAIKALLTSGGAVTDSTGYNLIASNARHSSVSMNGSSIETWDDSGSSNFGLTVPAYVRSITRKPDSQQLYGLLTNNEVVHLDGSGGQSALTSCPFETCTIPKWIQSISAGFGKNLYGIDAGGGVYKITSTGLTKITDVNPLINQVVIH